MSRWFSVEEALVLYDQEIVKEKLFQIWANLGKFLRKFALLQTGLG